MARHSAPRNRAARWRKLRAVLAGGLVLGVGATATLAAWNDNEYGQGTFTASRFDIQGSVDGGGTWSDNAASPGAAMTFNGAGMSPTATRFASLQVRTKVDSTVAGTATLQTPTNSNPTLAAALQYRVVLYTGTCNAGSFTAGSTYLVGTSTVYAALDSVVTANPLPIGAAGATPLLLCFQVLMPAGASTTLQGLSNTAVWRVLASSSS